ncbi:MAG TPA: twin-arginine translocation pathway signal protein, partial [Brevundimonas sp.]|nr:twin-arginine translocation pathway signal protein [Brevundimonas sp.]
MPEPVPTPAVAPVVLSGDPAPLDPKGMVRKEVMDRAMAALDIHHRKIPQRDRMYLVDFKVHSAEPRL